MKSSITAFAMMLALTSLSGCSVLIGNVRPVEEPAPLEETEAKAASAVPLLPLPWKHLDAPQAGQGSTSAGSLVPELSFQNQETGSTLAFTSGCRKSYQKAPPSLRRVVQSLGSGLTRIQNREQSETSVSGVPALRSRITGWAGGSLVTIDNVVLARQGCVFDLTLVSLARHHDQDHPAFDKVLAALPLSK